MRLSRQPAPRPLAALVAMPLVLSSATALAGTEPFRLSIFHNNDGESQLVDAGSGLTDFGGIARFATVLSQLRSADGALGGVVTISSGDNFLAGPEWEVSLLNGIPYFDAVGMELIGYDAICIGNHEFDFGPEILANFIASFGDGVPFLSANLDVSAEPTLQALQRSGRIAARTTVSTGGRQVGIVGATTPDLPFISSPGGVVVDSDVLGAVQAEVDALSADGVDIVILISHLQGIGSDLALIAQLRDVDVVIAGGGDELLANPGTLLVPDDAVDNNGDGMPDALFGPYPLLVSDADGATIPVVTTRGDYRYVGRLVVELDEAGTLLSVDPGSGPVRVAGGDNPDAVQPDAVVQALVVDPIAAALEALAANVVAISEVPLDGVNSSIRSRETNLGNLCADSTLWQAVELAKSFSLPRPDVAFQNGGGIRNNNVLPAGPLTELDTFSILPFSNFVSIVPNVPPTVIRDILENAVSRVSPPPGFPSGGTGRFAQVAGFSFSYEVDVPPGSRVRDVVLDDGRAIMLDGAILTGAPSVTVATINFLANGGDEYPFDGLPFVSLGVSYQQALRNYLEDALVGVVSASEYPVGGEGRIVRIDNPADLDNNSVINGADLGILLNLWESSDPDADLNGDGVVDGADLGILLDAWTL